MPIILLNGEDKPANTTIFKYKYYTQINFFKFIYFRVNWKKI